MKKCICYSIWGNKPEYTYGIQKNYDLIKKYLPDWQMVVYYDSSVPSEFVNCNNQIEWILVEDDSYGMFWRFEHINKCDIFLSRDLDSRISEREVYCINKWLESDFKFLSIRDKIPQHYEWPYMGGMFGIKNGIDDEDIHIMNQFKKHHHYTTDQQFFHKHIYPKYKDTTLFLGPKEDLYLKETWSENFIGQGYYEDDSFRYDPKTGLVIPRKEVTQMILLQSYYNPKQEDRRAEIEYCLEQNLNNPNIQKVILFLDNESVEYPEHSKIEALLTKDVAFPEEKGTFTFSMAFGYAMQKHKDDICCLINNDIFLDHDVFSDMTEIKNLVENNIVLSLSRHEYDMKTKTGVLDENFRRMMFAHTQDAWIFKANFCPNDSGFAPGTLGSDNAINDRLKKHGKVPINLGTKYKIYHVDTARGKTSANFLNKDFRSKEREKYPEESGQLLTPDYGMINGMSLDQFAKQLNFNHIDMYEILCEMMTKKVKIKNR